MYIQHDSKLPAHDAIASAFVAPWKGWSEESQKNYWSDGESDIYWEHSKETPVYTPPVGEEGMCVMFAVVHELRQVALDEIPDDLLMFRRTDFERTDEISVF